ncbi:hypothetical protein [Roseofilum sp. Belize Diploria]|uniref:hypothetical protein n=1 Tax=Roseofilum sp. Belize Diploria TaxID=2821501 RepID=UPI001B2C1518|nr:hypothetical protein [Roseofilum sp. Belize Diploria]MBP0008068.1 hypothetical protein [Roseofilum sp. Belize Diploria]
MNNHNKERIELYRDKAIALLQQIKAEDQTDIYLEACNELSHLQGYLSLAAPKYPIAQDVFNPRGLK